MDSSQSESALVFPLQQLFDCLPPACKRKGCHTCHTASVNSLHDITQATKTHYTLQHRHFRWHFDARAAQKELTCKTCALASIRWRRSLLALRS